MSQRYLEKNQGGVYVRPFDKLKFGKEFFENSQKLTSVYGILFSSASSYLFHTGVIFIPAEVHFLEGVRGSVPLIEVSVEVEGVRRRRPL